MTLDYFLSHHGFSTISLAEVAEIAQEIEDDGFDGTDLAALSLEFLWAKSKLEKMLKQVEYNFGTCEVVLERD